MLNIKIDPALKSEAKKVAEAMGIPLGTITNALLRKFVREKEINLSLDYYPNNRLKKSITEGEQEYKDGKLEEFSSVEDLIRDLNS